MNTGKTLGIFFSTGDLGDVGRHAVAAALELPQHMVDQVRVFSRQTETLEETQWKCACRQHHISDSDKKRLRIIKLDCTRDEIAPHLKGVDAVISCLGNRKPFHPDCIAKVGTERILEAMIAAKVDRIAMLSSVGIADDWPPMEWSREGNRLQAFFRTICWVQYQDLSGAELAVRKAEQQSSNLDFLIARPVLLPETTAPAGSWYLQKNKYEDHPDVDLAKMDCARFMVQECIHCTISRKAVVVGDLPKEE